MPFNWETDRAMSCKCLLDANGVTDEQAEMLKLQLAEIVGRLFPGQEGAVKVSIAEAGSRRWAPVGDKAEVGVQLTLHGIGASRSP
jgi:hypothetical protein